jgi:hypothetical protein
MAINIFLAFPEDDGKVLNVANESNWTTFLNTIKLVKNKSNVDGIKVFYDANNAKTFIDSVDILGEYLNDPKNQLQTFLGRTLQNTQDSIKKCSAHHYIQYTLLQVDHAHNLLAEIAERQLLFPTEKYVLINFENTHRIDRSHILIFKDLITLQDKPSEFIPIIVLDDDIELELWLSTNHIVEFSLLDRHRFQKTCHIVQGKSVYQEINHERFWHLDNLHKNEYEVYDSQHKHIGVANLQGVVDDTKKVNGRTF